VKALVLVAVPPGVVTETLTAPAGAAGVVAVMDVAEVTVKAVAGAEPNVTTVAPVRLVPVIVTMLPPAVVSLAGLTEVMVGAGTT
jgi:hypothetical protein